MDTRTDTTEQVKVCPKSGFVDILNVRLVDFQISGDGSQVWLHTSGGTKLKISGITGAITVSDGRFPGYVKEPLGMAAELARVRDVGPTRVNHRHAA
jgi:hypothetical protein